MGGIEDYLASTWLGKAYELGKKAMLAAETGTGTPSAQLAQETPKPTAAPATAYMPIINPPTTAEEALAQWAAIDDQCVAEEREDALRQEKAQAHWEEQLAAGIPIRENNENSPKILWTGAIGGIGGPDTQVDVQRNSADRQELTVTIAIPADEADRVGFMVLDAQGNPVEGVHVTGIDEEYNLVRSMPVTLDGGLKIDAVIDHHKIYSVSITVDPGTTLNQPVYLMLNGETAVEITGYDDLPAYKTLKELETEKAQQSAARAAAYEAELDAFSAKQRATEALRIDLPAPAPAPQHGHIDLDNIEELGSYQWRNPDNILGRHSSLTGVEAMTTEELIQQSIEVQALIDKAKTLQQQDRANPAYDPEQNPKLKALIEYGDRLGAERIWRGLSMQSNGDVIVTNREQANEYSVWRTQVTSNDSDVNPGLSINMLGDGAYGPSPLQEWIAAATGDDKPIVVAQTGGSGIPVMLGTVATEGPIGFATLEEAMAFAQGETSAIESGLVGAARGASKGRFGWGVIIGTVAGAAAGIAGYYFADKYYFSKKERDEHLVELGEAYQTGLAAAKEPPKDVPPEEVEGYPLDSIQVPGEGEGGGGNGGTAPVEQRQPAAGAGPGNPVQPIPKEAPPATLVSTAKCMVGNKEVQAEETMNLSLGTEIHYTITGAEPKPEDFVLKGTRTKDEQTQETTLSNDQGWTVTIKKGAAEETWEVIITTKKDFHNRKEPTIGSLFAVEMNGQALPGRFVFERATPSAEQPKAIALDYDSLE